MVVLSMVLIILGNSQRDSVEDDDDYSLNEENSSDGSSLPFPLGEEMFCQVRLDDVMVAAYFRPDDGDRGKVTVVATRDLSTWSKDFSISPGVYDLGDLEDIRLNGGDGRSTAVLELAFVDLTSSHGGSGDGDGPDDDGPDDDGPDDDGPDDDGPDDDGPDDDDVSDVIVFKLEILRRDDEAHAMAITGPVVGTETVQLPPEDGSDPTDIDLVMASGFVLLMVAFLMIFQQELARD